MTISNYFRRLAAVALATVGAACSTPGAQHVFPPAGTPADLPASATMHLYVIVTTATKFVAEYPIVNGIPGANPDRSVLGLTAPNALTVDRGGDLYVLDLKTIKEFAPGASGNARPIREIDVPVFNNINTLAVDRHGYLYVGQKHHVYVYAAGAHGHAKPFAIFWPDGYPSGFAVGADNDFYALGSTQSYDPYLAFRMHTGVYAAAPKLQRVREFCSPVFSNSGIDYGVALDGHGSLFTTYTYFISSYPSGQIDVYPQDANTCPTDPSTIITTSNPTLREPVYIAAAAPYLYVGDVFYGNGGVVFTLRTSGSPQQPLGTLYVDNSQPHNIFGIAIGP